MRGLVQDQSAGHVALVLVREAEVLGHDFGVVSFQLQGDLRADHVEDDAVKILDTLGCQQNADAVLARLADEFGEGLVVGELVSLIDDGEDTIGDCLAPWTAWWRRFSAERIGSPQP